MSEGSNMLVCFYGAKFPLDLNEANVVVVMFSRSFCSF